MTTENITLSVADLSLGNGFVPVIGLPGPLFTVIHATALASLSVTTLVSCCLLVNLFRCRTPMRSLDVTATVQNQGSVLTRIAIISRNPSHHVVSSPAAAATAGGCACDDAAIEPDFESIDPTSNPSSFASCQHRRLACIRNYN